MRCAVETRPAERDLRGKIAWQTAQNKNNADGAKSIVKYKNTNKLDCKITLMERQSVRLSIGSNPIIPNPIQANQILPSISTVNFAVSSWSAFTAGCSSSAGKRNKALMFAHKSVMLKEIAPMCLQKWRLAWHVLRCVLVTVWLVWGFAYIILFLYFRSNVRYWTQIEPFSPHLVVLILFFKFSWNQTSSAI